MFDNCDWMTDFEKRAHYSSDGGGIDHKTPNSDHIQHVELRRNELT